MTTIRLYDSMTRSKREFVPLDPANVRLYLCGPTVYDRAHIGNARAAVVGDVLFRLLRHVYGAGHVTYARNITDIDDKIMVRARESGRSIDDITAETTQWYQEDMAALGCLPPTHEPRATGHVAGMVAMIEGLIAKGHAYAAEGHVLFAVDSFADYGRLSGRSVDDMIAGARVEVAPYKKNPMDFVLWKPSAPDQPGWESPWSRGRPGWHIECSAMSRTLLGPDFDIHAGGSDLLFPHHENEIAQSRCADPGHGFARYWVHNGMVQVEGRKMSKSLGNFFTVSDILDDYKKNYFIENFGLAIRFRFLMGHYRSDIDAGHSYLEEAAIKLGEFWSVLRDWKSFTNPNRYKIALEASGITSVLDDDLNTPNVIAILYKLLDNCKYPFGASIEEMAKQPTQFDQLGAALDFLGFGIDALGSFDPDRMRRRRMQSLDTSLRQQIDALLTARAEARKAKEFAKADAIRKALDAAGVVVMDRPGAPTEWELGPTFDAAKLEAIEP